LSASARKRLEAIQMMEDLGVGFHLAMHDLEIRGAGELLGESQSGEMQEIGFSLYAEMLNQAVKALRAGKEPDLDAPLSATTEINLHAPALLPAGYCPDVHERLVLYKRLANCATLDELDAMLEELVDRFGLLPPEARTLLATHRLRILAREVGVARIDAHAESILLQFVPEPPIDSGRIIELIQTRKNYKLAGPDRLRVLIATADAEARARAVAEIFGELLSKATPALSLDGSEGRPPRRRS
jgi:transcription-repair coupling factor (superfamily II helicase)